MTFEQWLSAQVPLQNDEVGQMLPDPLHVTVVKYKEKLEAAWTAGYMAGGKDMVRYREYTHLDPTV